MAVKYYSSSTDTPIFMDLISLTFEQSQSAWLIRLMRLFKNNGFKI